MARYRAKRRAIKKHRNYTMDEAARVLGVAKGTIRRWIKDGLPAIDDHKPFLIIGRDLIDYLESKTPPKQKCQLHQCYCLSCRAPRDPAFGEVEYLPVGPCSGNLRALCAVCTTVMHKRIGTGKLEALKAIVSVSTPQAEQPLGDSHRPSLNEHLGREPETHAKAS